MLIVIITTMQVVLNAALHAAMKPEKQADGKSTKIFTCVRVCVCGQRQR